MWLWSTVPGLRSFRFILNLLHKFLTILIIFLNFLLKFLWFGLQFLNFFIDDWLLILDFFSFNFFLFVIIFLLKSIFLHVVKWCVSSFYIVDRNWLNSDSWMLSWCDSEIRSCFIRWFVLFFAPSLYLTAELFFLNLVFHYVLWWDLLDYISSMILRSVDKRLFNWCWFFSFFLV